MANKTYVIPSKPKQQLVAGNVPPGICQTTPGVGGFIWTERSDWKFAIPNIDSGRLFDVKHNLEGLITGGVNPCYGLTRTPAFAGVQNPDGDPCSGNPARFNTLTGENDRDFNEVLVFGDATFGGSYPSPHNEPAPDFPFDASHPYRYPVPAPGDLGTPPNYKYALQPGGYSAGSFSRRYEGTDLPISLLGDLDSGDWDQATGHNSTPCVYAYSDFVSKFELVLTYLFPALTTSDGTLCIGGCVTITGHASTAGGVNGTWVISDSSTGTIVGTNQGPNGWNVSFDPATGKLTVCAPCSAVPETVQIDFFYNGQVFSILLVVGDCGLCGGGGGGDAPPGGRMPSNLERPLGLYHRAAINGGVSVWNSNYSIPYQPDITGTLRWASIAQVTLFTTDIDPVLACDERGVLFVLFAREAAGTPPPSNVLQCASGDDGASWSTPAACIGGAKYPAICSKRGRILRAGYIDDGSGLHGTLIAVFQGIGDAAAGSVFTFKDSAGADIAAANDRFSVVFDDDDARRSYLHVNVNGVGATSIWFSTEEGCATWGASVTGISGGKFPTLATRHGRLLAAAYIDDGSGVKGTIRAIYRGPGDTAFGSPFTFKDSSGADIIVSNDKIGIAFAQDEQRRCVGHFILHTDGASSDWWSTDETCTTWEKGA